MLQELSMNIYCQDYCTDEIFTSFSSSKTYGISAQDLDESYDIFQSKSPKSIARSISTKSADSESEDNSSVEQQKKKRIRTNRRLYPFPRIVKRDIRRIYPGMLANVMNSGSLALLSDFLTEFSTKKCQYIDYFPGSESVNLSWNRSFEGVPAIMQYFASYWTATAQALIPDFHIKVRWASVKQFLNQDHSELMCGLTFTATPIFDLQALIAAALPKSSSTKRKSSARTSKPSRLPYQHTQTLYLTPDMDEDEDDYDDRSLYPPLSRETGNELVQLAQFAFQSMPSSSSTFSVGQEFDSKLKQSAQQSKFSIFSAPNQEIRYDGMVTFRLDEKSRIRGLEFGPEIQRAALALSSSSPSSPSSSTLRPGSVHNSAGGVPNRKRPCVAEDCFQFDVVGSTSEESAAYCSSASSLSSELCELQVDQDFMQLWDTIADQSCSVSSIPV